MHGGDIQRKETAKSPSACARQGEGGVIQGELAKRKNPYSEYPERTAGVVLNEGTVHLN